MIIFSWNVRGMNDPLKQQEVLDFLQRNKVDCGAIIETHIKAHSVHIVKLSSLLSAAQHYTTSGPGYLCYALNRASKRLVLWDQLRTLSAGSLPWICLGDFNVSHFSRTGFLSQMGKIDRLLVNRLWFLSVSSTVVFLPSGVSDHSPILPTIASSVVLRRPFRYLNCWSLSPAFTEKVLSNWQVPVHGGRIFSLFTKLRSLRGALKSIHVNEFLGIANRVADAKARLSDCQSLLQASAVNQTLLAEEKVLLLSYKRLRNAELRVLAQKAKIQHFQLSDANTRYFYASIAARKARNNIGAIEDMHGQACYGHDKVSLTFLEFDKNLLGATEEVFRPPTELFSRNTL
ncbi:hypothetical protein RND81_13G064900 [Saponaria officinalis]|uniref:Endonuclease/exonuclease/phosphatase domain-containing protein n=1 Tax=Saponaria officinalis TaxID=3572 RepID=A0AAW1GUP5_SAPOF